MTTRRSFLAATAGLLATRRAFATALRRHPGPPRRDDYTLDEGLTYLDHAAIGTIPRVVQEAHRGYLATCERNPSRYVWDEPWLGERERTRGRAAAFLSAASEEVAITHNTTEGFNLLAQGLPLERGDEVLFSSLNHVGASACWDHRAQVRGFAVRRFAFPLERAPEIGAEEFVKLHVDQIAKNTRVLVLPHVDNVIGYRAPLEALSAAARKAGVEWIAVDGAQAVGMVPVNPGGAGVDFYATSPHKWLQAPKGLGLFWLRKPLLEVLRPMWVSFGQDRWAGTARIYEDYGTRDLPEVLALRDAITFHRRTKWQERIAHYRGLWAHARERVAGDDRLTWRSPAVWERGGSLYCFEIPGAKREAVAEKLEEKGVVVRLFPREGGVLVRIAPNLMNTTEDLDRLFDAL